MTKAVLLHQSETTRVTDKKDCSEISDSTQKCRTRADPRKCGKHTTDADVYRKTERPKGAKNFKKE